MRSVSISHPLVMIAGLGISVCEAISVHDNHFAANGQRPSGALGRLVSTAIGSLLPDVLVVVAG